MVVALSARASEQSVDDPARLLEESGALLHGDFTLASGKRSEYYFDSKKLTLYPPGAYFVARQIVRKLDELGIQYVGGTAYSAIPIVSHVALYSQIRPGNPIRAFYHRKEAKGHGTKANAEGQFPLSDEPVAILEDVVTTGDSLLDAIGQAKASGYNVIYAMALVDRDEESGREKVKAAGYEFWSLFRVKWSGGKVSFVCNGG